jgi:hypothetical protein
MKANIKIPKTKEDIRAKTTAARVHDAKVRVQTTAARAYDAKIRTQTTESQVNRSNIRTHATETQKAKATSAKAADRTKKDEIEIQKAESEARMADDKAKMAEIEARRAIMKAEAHAHRAKVEVGKAEEYARQATTQAEAKAKFLARKAEAEVKRDKAKAKTAEAKQKTRETDDEEVRKVRKDAYNAEAEAKKAKVIAEKATAATEAKIKHVLAASQAESKAEICRAEAKDRMAEANARKAEANARRAEAKAIKAGDKLKAKAKKSEAQAKKAEALAIKAKIDLIKIERKTEAEAEAKKKLNGPLPPNDKLPEKRARYTEKKHLSQPGLLNQVREIFLQIPDHSKRTNKTEKISLCDCLMSGLAVFSLKYPSLLQFENDSQESGTIQHNLKTLYKVQQAPSDTYMRERLDVIDPNLLRPTFTKLFSALQRGKELEKYVFYEDYYLMLGDATGYFSSKNIHCENCCKKEHQDGSVTYYHQMMSAVIAHPNHATVIPLCPEPIIKTDGATKNDCERNASERLYKDIRREHPHLRLIVTEDALGSNGPHIRLLQELDMRFILVVKPDGNKSLFEFLNGIERQECIYSDDKFSYKIQFVNGVPLSDSHSDLDVNFIEAWVYDNKGNQQYHNTWITDISITKTNAYCLFRGGRTKWKIENETFNTLKNQDYHFEHNYGHGKQHLSTVLVFLMMLAFLIDQIQQSCCGLFQMAWEKMKSKVRLWWRLRAYFTTQLINSWEDLWQAIACGHGGVLNISPDTS